MTDGSFESNFADTEEQDDARARTGADTEEQDARARTRSVRDIDEDELRLLASSLVRWRPATAGSSVSLFGLGLLTSIGSFVASQALTSSFPAGFASSPWPVLLLALFDLFLIGTTIFSYAAVIRRQLFLGRTRQLRSDLTHGSSDRYLLAEAVGRRDALIESKDLRRSRELDRAVQFSIRLSEDRVSDDRGLPYRRRRRL